MKRKIFTLIELLIVIAIIAILAAMLLPALNKARERAKATECTNNLKTVGMVIALYCDEFNGTFPVYYSSGGTTSYYWGGNTNGLWTEFYKMITRDNSIPGWVNYVPPGVVCPTVKTFPNVFQAKVSGWPKFDGWVSLGFYGINTKQTISSGNWKVHRFFKAVSGAGKILMAETNQPNAAPSKNKGSWCIYPDLADPSRVSSRINYSHNNRANVLFFDLHVNSAAPQTLLEDSCWKPYEN